MPYQGWLVIRIKNNMTSCESEYLYILKDKIYERKKSFFKKKYIILIWFDQLLAYIWEN